MPYLKLPHVNLFYEFEKVSDASRTITLVNGHTRSSKDFRLLSRSLLKNGISTLVFDNRGAGETQSYGPFSLQNIVEDLIELWNHLGIEKSHLLGISMGGMICQLLAASEPSRVQKLVLISTSASSRWVAPEANQSWGSTIASVLAKLDFYFAPDFKQRNKLLVEGMAKQILNSINNGNFAETALQQRQAMAGYADMTLITSKIKAETLLIHGSEDKIIFPAAAEELQKLITNSRQIPINNCGHLLLAECPQQLYKVIADFLLEP